MLSTAPKTQTARAKTGRCWFDIFGPHDQIKGSDNDLFAVAERLAASGKDKPKVYMWCGTEDFLYGQNVRMRDHLNKLGYDLTYEESPGDHQWKYWDEKIQTVLAWLPHQGIEKGVYDMALIHIGLLSPRRWACALPAT